MHRLIFISIILTLLSGCSISAVQYQPDFNLVNDLKDSDLNKMSVGDFSSKSSKVNKVSIRGSSMVSPFNNSYALYLKSALEEQLKQADLYNEASNIEIRGELLSNNLDASGINIGTASISAKFIVLDKDTVIFEKDIHAAHEWESSFVGAIAVPNAQNNYPVVVQKLITNLMKDLEFVESVKRQTRQ